jgi:site-specific DNA-methyltransferase (adenine-specific)
MALEQLIEDKVLLCAGDAWHFLRDNPGARYDSVVTDPPYEIGFMGKGWDDSRISFSVEFWSEVCRVLKPGGHVVAFGSSRSYHRLACAIEDGGFEIRDSLMWLYGTGYPKSHNQSDGWGTALKPAFEPIVLARNPLSEKTVAENVQRWGTGAINIDGCRVGTEDMSAQWDRSWSDNAGEMGKRYPQSGRISGKIVPPGRWPANVCHDGSEEVAGLFPENASRFFYSAKADADDRIRSKHPTVKPVDLMQWLIRLVTPKNGLVLDPFAGTGTTAEAALYEGMRCVLVESEREYQDDIRRRLSLYGHGQNHRLYELGKLESVDLGPLFQFAGMT